jgi:hypothetical protein
VGGGYPGSWAYDFSDYARPPFDPLAAERQRLAQKEQELLILEREEQLERELELRAKLKKRKAKAKTNPLGETPGAASGVGLVLGLTGLLFAVGMASDRFRPGRSVVA